MSVCHAICIFCDSLAMLKQIWIGPDQWASFGWDIWFGEVWWQEGAILNSFVVLERQL